jgi:hypothetical protein
VNVTLIAGWQAQAADSNGKNTPFRREDEKGRSII